MQEELFPGLQIPVVYAICLDRFLLWSHTPWYITDCMIEMPEIEITIFVHEP